MDNIIIQNLKHKISEGENYSSTGQYRNSFYFKSSLATAKGILSGIENPPKGKSNYYPDKDIYRAIFNLESSMRSPV
jgi:hypothetical protein